MKERFQCDGTECVTLQAMAELIQSEASIVVDIDQIKSILVRQCEARRECLSSLTVQEVDDEIEVAKERQKAAETKLFFRMVEDISDEY